MKAGIAQSLEESNVESDGRQNLFAFHRDKEKVFSIECKEITYHLMPAYAFYFSSMRTHINLQKLVEKMH